MVGSELPVIHAYNHVMPFTARQHQHSSRLWVHLFVQSVFSCSKTTEHLGLYIIVNKQPCNVPPKLFITAQQQHMKHWLKTPLCGVSMLCVIHQKPVTASRLVFSLCFSVNNYTIICPYYCKIPGNCGSMFILRYQISALVLSALMHALNVTTILSVFQRKPHVERLLNIWYYHMNMWQSIFPSCLFFLHQTTRSNTARCSKMEECLLKKESTGENLVT